MDIIGQIGIKDNDETQAYKCIDAKLYEYFQYIRNVYLILLFYL